MRRIAPFLQLKSLWCQRWCRISLWLVLLGIFLLPQIASLSTITDEKIIELTNETRSKAGLPALTANQLLTKAAYDKGQAILKSQKFQHTLDGNSFSYWIKTAGYEYNYAGENLAVDFMSSEGVVSAWLDSPTHKKNLLHDKFTEIGVAILEGEFQGRETTLVVQEFGTPRQPVFHAAIGAPYIPSPAIRPITISPEQPFYAIESDYSANPPGISSPNWLPWPVYGHMILPDILHFNIFVQVSSMLSLIGIALIGLSRHILLFYLFMLAAVTMGYLLLLKKRTIV